MRTYLKGRLHFYVVVVTVKIFQYNLTSFGNSRAEYLDFKVIIFLTRNVRTCHNQTEKEILTRKRKFV